MCSSVTNPINTLWLQMYGKFTACVTKWNHAVSATYSISRLSKLFSHAKSNGKFPSFRLSVIFDLTFSVYRMCPEHRYPHTHKHLFIHINPSWTGIADIASRYLMHSHVQSDPSRQRHCPQPISNCWGLGTVHRHNVHAYFVPSALGWSSAGQLRLCSASCTRMLWLWVCWTS